MKKLRLLFFSFIAFLFISQNANATHLAGGVISYEALDSNQYRVYLSVLRDCIGATFNQQYEHILYRNQCGVSSYFQVSLLAGSGYEIPTPCDNTPTNCSNPPGFRKGYTLHVFSGIFTIPNAVDSCSGWTLSWGSCCRNGSSNLIGQPPFYIESYINNSSWVMPKNSSVRPLIREMLAFCFDEDINIEYEYRELQNDSIIFGLVPAQTTVNDTAQYNNFPFIYTYLNPTGSIIAPFLNTSTGNIRLLGITRVQDIVFVLRAYELRERLPGVWDTVGWITFDFLVSLGPTRYCDKTNPTFLNVNIIRNCGDSLFLVTFNKEILCSTIDSNGSELRLTESNNNNTIPIKKVEPVNCRTTFDGLVTNRVIVSLDQVLYKNGIYYLVSRIGIDGDTYGTSCNSFMDPFDTLGVIINDCLALNTLETNVSSGFKVYPNPASNQILLQFPSNIFGNAKISLVNFLGQTVMHSNIFIIDNQTESLSINALPNGIYTLVLENGGRQFQQKIVKN